MPKELPGIGLVYDLQEVAALLDVSIYTVQRDYRRGQLPGRKFGRRILFTGAAIKGFLESGSPTRRGSKGQPEQQGQAKPKAPPTTREQQNLVEKNRIIDAMKQAGNYRERAAKILGISRVTLQARFKKYGLQFSQNRGIKN